MKIIYCNDDLNPRSVDSCFEVEANAAADCGLAYELIDFNALRRGSREVAVRRVTGSECLETAVYRGWMLTPTQYELLYLALQEKNVRLINSPQEYQHCHWLPESYPIIEDCTPRSIWLPATDGPPKMEAVTEAVKVFDSSPLIVKDYVKSRKHEWFEACFIPNASDASHVRRVVERFIDLQAEDLQGGLVFREFVEFAPIGTHPKSGMPLTLEFRLFVLDGSVVIQSPYWDRELLSEPPPLEQFNEVLKQVKSRFFSGDVAKTVDGRWLIVELGDGQVSGLPDQCNVAAFYNALAERLGGTNDP